MNISTFVTPITKFGAKAIFKVKAAAPEILIGAGVVGIVGTVVLACKETPKAVEILEEHQDMMQRIKEVHDDPEEYGIEYSETDYRKDVFIQYMNTAFAFVKNYIPAASLLALSIGAILYSHGIMSRRNLELMAAYKALEESYNTYRQRIKERYGETADFSAAVIDEFTNEEAEFVDNNGNKSKGVKAKANLAASPYAKFFDEFNPNWEKDPSLNLFFLKAQEKYANDKLQAQGFLFLNDVYEALGFPKTSAGQLVGWYLGGSGDDFVTFNIFDGDDIKKRDFVNGLERSILIDPNVDGVIYDMI